MQQPISFLMFEGRAEEAMNFYTSVFPDSKIIHISRYEAGQPGKEGSVIYATFSIKGQTYMCIDSAVSHGFTFTPAISFYIPCDSEAEIDELYSKLGEGGKVMMPLGAYPFSKKYCWLSDKFGVSWQLTLV
ncbi:MAG: VOC family protein [Mucilaginibacter sp.]